ncbi:RT_RNaseH_2 domain-containing protein [Nephila pilipes]|uniref:RT_RNaseH_2 domain-containing protein n=1 Tax=Nephila pilipes TaxID=299642 RepID=A0A8X6UHN8_NEPPI|nr:RT_RNaseH_2 domain-containing protein [Nephila pilipes]
MTNSAHLRLIIITISLTEITIITISLTLVCFKQALPTFVETDPSYSGLDVVLSQGQNGKHRVIQYASCTLTNKLCTALHWALSETFRLYLLGHKIELITDNYASAYVVAKSSIKRKFA